jgi:hypothetical protein
MKVIKNITESIGEITKQKMILIALDNCTEYLKGIKQILISTKLYDLISLKTEGDLELEDSYFEMVYKAIDSTQWGSGIRKDKKAMDFLREIEELKKGE